MSLYVGTSIGLKPARLNAAAHLDLTFDRPACAQKVATCGRFTGVESRGCDNPVI